LSQSKSFPVSHLLYPLTNKWPTNMLKAKISVMWGVYKANKQKQGPTVKPAKPKPIPDKTLPRISLAWNYSEIVTSWEPPYKGDFFRITWNVAKFNNATVIIVKRRDGSHLSVLIVNKATTFFLLANPLTTRPEAKIAPIKKFIMHSPYYVLLL